MTKHYIIPIFVPHFGCPHDCIFCNQKKITGLNTNVKPEEVENIIEDYLRLFRKDSYIEVAFYGGSFTAIDIDIQSELLEIPFKYKTQGMIDAIRLSTRPDAIDNKILDNLKKYSVDTIELGVQSLDEEVLNASERGHTAKDVYKASELIKEYGFNLGLQMMLGLPEDNFEKSLYTCREFIKLDPFNVRIYPTLVIKGTFLEEQCLHGKYRPLSIEEAVEESSILLMLFYINDINVIRVGLQPTENIQMGKDVVAGPFHPAFRQLVESNIYKIIIDFYLSINDIETKNKELILELNSRLVSFIAGQKSSNTIYFKNRYKFRNIKIYGNDFDLNEIAIKLDDFYDKINIKSLMKSYLMKNSLV